MKTFVIFPHSTSAALNIFHTLTFSKGPCAIILQKKNTSYYEELLNNKIHNKIKDIFD